MRSQIATSSEYGGRRYLPYVFTESGIAMLSAVPNTDVAVEVSARIMNSFVEMRRFIASNAALFERISAVELKQLEYQKQTDERFDKVFEYIDDHAESEQKIFFEMLMRHKETRKNLIDSIHYSIATTVLQNKTKRLTLHLL